MSKYSSEDLNRLIEETRVHRSVYLDPEIFDLEMERVFTRAWVYVGHESQVKKPGDYFCTWIGRQPVILSRHTDGQIYVLFNRCAHRGARVLNEEKGNAKQVPLLLPRVELLSRWRVGRRAAGGGLWGGLRPL